MHPPQKSVNQPGKALFFWSKRLTCQCHCIPFDLLDDLLFQSRGIRRSRSRRCLRRGLPIQQGLNHLLILIFLFGKDELIWGDRTRNWLFGKWWYIIITYYIHIFTFTHQLPKCRWIDHTYHTLFGYDESTNRSMSSSRKMWKFLSSSVDVILETSTKSWDPKQIKPYKVDL